MESLFRAVGHIRRRDLPYQGTCNWHVYGRRNMEQMITMFSYPVNGFAHFWHTAVQVFVVHTELVGGITNFLHTLRQDVGLCGIEFCIIWTWNSRTITSIYSQRHNSGMSQFRETVPSLNKLRYSWQWLFITPSLGRVPASDSALSFIHVATTIVGAGLAQW